MAVLALPLHSYRLRSGPASTARLVNCYIEALPADAKTPALLSRAPGIVNFTSLVGSPIRGLHTFQGLAYAVCGTTLFRFNADGSASNMGTVPGTVPVSMAHNDQYLVIVSEPNGYYTDGVSGFVIQITDIDFTSRGAKYVKFCDNYMLFMEPNSGRFFAADLGSVTSFNSLKFATAEGSPDNLVGMEVSQRQVILLGTDSGEIWNNTGVSGFPFERAINGFFEYGCLNGDAIAKFSNTVAWPAHDFTVRLLEGATPRRISTSAIEVWLSSVDPETLRAYAYDQDGHFFYVLCSGTGCFAYDSSSGEWAERSTYPNDYYAWQYHTFARGKNYVGNYYSSSVGYFDHTDYREDAGIQRMEATFQPVYAENKKAKHKRLEIVLESGTGLVSGQGSDPEIMCAYSDDGGKTYTNLPNKKIGKIGEYRHRVWWSALGSAAQRVYRIAISDPVRIAICQATLDVEGGYL